LKKVVKIKNPNTFNTNRRGMKMTKLKAKFNTEQILNGNVNYPKSFVEMVKKYKDKVIEIEEEPFGGYELELEGSTWALDDEELIVMK
jgi:hypothetical protein